MFEGLGLHEIYSLIARFFFIIAILGLLLYLFFKSGRHTIFLQSLVIFSRKNKHFLIHLALMIFIVAIVAFGLMSYMIYALDVSTKVTPPGKIVVIEIDDYWNLEDTGEYFGKYGYDMETFRAVSNILDKYEYTASLGVSPHIFVEEIKETFALEDDLVMVSYLLELQDKGYELAMHGYSHCRNRYYCPKYEEVYFNILKGKSELEEMFGTEFVTYLPPGNEWTTEQYENVKGAGFKFIANTHVPIAYYDEDVIITPKGYDPIYHYAWYEIDFRHTGYEEWISSYEKTDFFILQLHCNTFDSQEKLDDLDKFLAYLKKKDTKVVTYSEAYDLLMEQDRILKSFGRFLFQSVGEQ